MRVAFLGAVPFCLIFGGGETQLINTMDALKTSGVDVRYYDYWDRYFSCDILHIFGCHYWSYQFAMLAKAKGIKIALSTISYNPNPRLLYKLWHYIDPFVPVDTTYRLNRQLVALSDILLPNSQVEADYLKTFFAADRAKIRIIHNAADMKFAEARPESFIQKYGIKDFVLCVGKIEPRKNQLNLVRALSGTGMKLVLIGSSIPQKIDYYHQVLNVISKEDNFYHIESLPHDSDLLASAYAAAKVHVLLGRNETPGIVNLEAGLAGDNIVVAACPPVREYLGDYALYCNPDSMEEVRKTVAFAMNKKKTTIMKEFILQNYTWYVAGEKTLDAYKHII